MSGTRTMPRTAPSRSTMSPACTSASSSIERASLRVVRRSMSGEPPSRSPAPIVPGGILSRCSQPSGRWSASVTRRYGHGSPAARRRRVVPLSPTRPVRTGVMGMSPRRCSARRLRPRSAPTNRATKSDAGLARMSDGVPTCATTPPFSNTATRSPILIASSTSWVTNRMVFASCSWRRRNSFWRRSRTIGSTAPKGSSMSITGGSAARARATPTRWRSPPDSWAG